MSPRKTKDNPLGLEAVDGDAVTELGIEIPGAAGGFRKPLDVDTTLLDMLKDVKKGDTVFCVLQLAKSKFRYEDAKNHDGLRRVDIFKVDGVALVDADMALGSVQEQRERVQTAIDEAAAQNTMVDAKGKEKPDPDHHTESAEA
jgi:hypothetical protein